jgi:UDP-2,3-diacylglucosamine pyrophosphatase LpxH
VRDIVIVSDLHLGAHDDSFYDDAFSRFADHLLDSDADLLLLGDALDFLEARPRATGGGKRIDTSEAAVHTTLEWIGRRHAPFFTALGRLAAAGHGVHVVPGNHDVELLRTSTQARFSELVGAASGNHDVSRAVAFHPWMFHVPGVLYAEHGHQYHDINAVSTLLRPEQPARPDRLALPIASYLVEGRPRFAIHALRHAVTLSSPALARRRSAYRRETLTPAAASVDLDAATLAALDRLSETDALSILRRLAGVARHGASNVATQRNDYLHRGAMAIDRVLRGAGAAVPHLAFGHTHIAERFAVTATPGAAEYLNCGTWSPFLPRGVPGEGRRLTFARVSAAEGARVLRWDDAAGRPVELPGS